MRIGVLGTGGVGQTIATKLVQVGHEVKMGSRSAGNEKAVGWVASAGAKASQGSFAEAAAFGELIFNCTHGGGTLEALKLATPANLANKILVDVSNPLDFSRGMPPTLFSGNTDSLGEQIQRTYPQTRVVKALNTVTADLMVNPRQLQDGDHHVFLCGNDAEAKRRVEQLLREGFGWRNVIDLGDIGNARGTESILPLWLRLYSAFQSAHFNFKVVR